MSDAILPLNMILDQVGRDKGIDKTVLVEAIEAAILTAAKRTFGQGRELEARFNEETEVVDLYLYMTVVEEIEFSEREGRTRNSPNCWISRRTVTASAESPPRLQSRSSFNGCATPSGRTSSTNTRTARTK